MRMNMYAACSSDSFLWFRNRYIEVVVVCSYRLVFETSGVQVTGPADRRTFVIGAASCVKQVGYHWYNIIVVNAF